MWCGREREGGGEEEGRGRRGEGGGGRREDLVEVVLCRVAGE